jgi:hypothetical protein
MPAPIGAGTGGMVLRMRGPTYYRLRLLVVTAVMLAALYVQPYGIVRSVMFNVGGTTGFYLLWRQYRRHRAARRPSPTA